MDNIQTLKPANVNFLSEDTKVNTYLGWEKCIFLQINRIGLLSATGNDDAFTDAIDVLDILLEADKDHRYQEELEAMKLKMIVAQGRAAQMEADEPEVYSQLNKQYAKEVMRMLMRLMKRKGMTPRIQVTDMIV